MGFLKNLFSKPPKPGKPIPVTDETFQELVLNSRIPAVVDFWSPSCSHCQVMGGLLNEIGPEFAGRVQIFMLNVGQNSQIASSYRIQGVPTVIFFLRGKEFDRIVGLLPLNPLKAKINGLIGTG
jgi:thioredoxin 1